MISLLFGGLSCAQAVDDVLGGAYRFAGDT
jgi:hypothetical protein